jgi:hypothetical protein
LVRLLWLQFYLNCSNHFEKERAHIANLQCGQTYFNNALESVEKKDWSISNKSAATPRQDAMNWSASCGYHFI